MGWFKGDSYQAKAYSSRHEAEWSHELIAGAAAFEAAKAYENHVASNGHPDEHATAKEIIAGLAGAFIDREAETKGLDWLDKEKVKREATEQATHAFKNSNDYPY